MEQSYVVQRDSLTNPIDYVFIMKEYSWQLEPGLEYACYMIYQPRVSFSKNTDYFTIIDSDGNECFKIVAKGVCTGRFFSFNIIQLLFMNKYIFVGPRIEFSKTKLFYFAKKERKSINKQIKIKNISKVSAIFQFDIDENQYSFKVSPSSGTLKSSSFINITIVFVPSRPGIYIYHLPCLFLNHVRFIFFYFNLFK